MNTLTYDHRTSRYTGTKSDGTYIEIGADEFAEAYQWRMEDGGMTYEEALAETADPDGWYPDMAGWIPADEHSRWAPTSRALPRPDVARR